VPPFGHVTKLRIFIDPDLLQYDEVWAAARTWNDNFGAAPADNGRVAGGVVTHLKCMWHLDVHKATARSSVELH
jgi:prolyl-tRNA editing enzyme YbaK/EbsC (Cys-tRNA(Pro) deacylase)